jgi:Lon protease-like protein
VPLSVQVLGRRRFRIIETWDQDGYRVAKVQWLQDVIPAPGSPEQKEIDRMARTAAEVVNTFLTRAQDAARKGAFSSSLDSSRDKLLSFFILSYI